MSDRSDERELPWSLLVAGLAVAVIVTPFLLDVNTGWFVLAIGVGSLLFVVALSMRSPSMGGRTAVHRRGG